jgi:hypothetical protein
MELKLEIDRIKEYIDSDLCKRCEEMSERLKECEQLMESYIQNFTEDQNN